MKQAQKTAKHEKPKNRVSQLQAKPPVSDGTLSSQRVEMSRSELDLYVKDGRPTGLLFSSVAMVKGVSVTALSRHVGIPEALVQSILNDHGLHSITGGVIKRVADCLGMDLSKMRFTPGRVHTFDMASIPRFTSGAQVRVAMRGIGLLSRGSRVAELRFGSGLKAAITGRKMFAIQSEGFRALLISARSSRFDIEQIPGAKWARSTNETSVVYVANDELIGNLVAKDITESEFDDLFAGNNAFSWNDIMVASRANGVSKREMMEFIRSRAEELDKAPGRSDSGGDAVERSVLRLVDADTKVAVG